MVPLKRACGSYVDWFRRGHDVAEHEQSLIPKPLSCLALGEGPRRDPLPRAAAHRWQPRPDVPPRTPALARAGAEVDLLFPWGPRAPWRRFRRDGIGFQPHFFVTNVLPLVMRDRIAPPLVALSLQPFALGPRRRFSRADDYDIVQFDFCAHPDWMERMDAGVRIVYSAHNVEYDYVRGHPPGWFLPSTLSRLPKLQRRAVQASELVITTTATDAALGLRELYGADVDCVEVPNGFERALLEFDRTALRRQARSQLGLSPDQRALLFVGGNAAHNRRAAEFLARELAPRLGDDARILLVGRSSSSGDPRAGRQAAAHGLRRGPATAARRCRCRSQPGDVGLGLEPQLLTYLAAGLPVVTTPIGMRGFEELREALTVAELDEFAGAVREPRPITGALRARLAGWTWDSLGHRLERAYSDLLSSGSAALRAGGTQRRRMPSMLRASRVAPCRAATGSRGSRECAPGTGLPGEGELEARRAGRALDPLVVEPVGIRERPAWLAGDPLDRRLRPADLLRQRGVVQLSQIGMRQAVRAELHPGFVKRANLLLVEQAARPAPDEVGFGSEPARHT